MEGLPTATLERWRRGPPSAEAWAAIFAVHTDEAGLHGARPPVLGSWSIEDGAVRFRPTFPFAPGQIYVARWRDRSQGPRDGSLTLRFQLPAVSGEPTTEVSAIYPTVAEVPENLLKVYLAFTAPMAVGEAARRVRLVDADGVPVRAPFVAVDHELWNPERTRLTLIFDPGRVKRGLRLHDEVGPPLAAGHRYRLIVDRGWEDARGLPLRRGFEKSFEVGPADRLRPDPTSWRLEPPAEPQAPVALSFPEPMDRALLERWIAVVDASGQRLEGDVRVDEEERGWALHPRRPWASGRYEVRVHPRLEDLAGNTPERLFDGALDSEPGAAEEGRVLVLAFELGPGWARGSER